MKFRERKKGTRGRIELTNARPLPTGLTLNRLHWFLAGEKKLKGARLAVPRRTRRCIKRDRVRQQLLLNSRTRVTSRLADRRSIAKMVNWALCTTDMRAVFLSLDDGSRNSNRYCMYFSAIESFSLLSKYCFAAHRFTNSP